MPTTKAQAQQILEALGMPEDVRVRAMMREYVFYYHERVAGGIYDGRLLLKDVRAARALLPDAERVVPYPGAKEMLAAPHPSEPGFMRSLLDAMLPELPPPRPRRTKAAEQ